MTALGLDVEPDLLAVVCSSHNGEDVHLDAVRRLLAQFGLTADDLETTPAYPLFAPVRDELVVAGARDGRVGLQEPHGADSRARLAVGDVE